MKTTLLAAVTLCVCLPSIVFGQANRTASPNLRVRATQSAGPTVSSKPTGIASQSCCGQNAEDVTRISSPQEEIHLTQLTIHARLMYKSAAPSLTPGVHLLSTSPDGHKFQATVNRQGVVSNWFVTEPSGLRLAQVNSNNGGGQVDVNRCMDEFLRRTEFCEWQGTFDSRYNYGRCYWEAWLGFLTCLESGLEGAAMR